ncbi:hypothetical protein FHS23_001946 [Prauserella isguenensis]|uniref:Uncharacterized protein n=1 Tax=Prauserella isguenensis TaxID=1470180 RepID=A0A839S0T0_9PSEU|nr:hypothetical protein [Prauserella isguenensis]MBB3050923.1 hypothetical protein [Prauserella isguenensis]
MSDSTGFVVRWDMAAGALVHAAIFVAPTIAVLLIVLTPDAARRAALRRRAAEGPVPRHRAVEVVAAELRRAHRALENLPGDASRFHRDEACARYDALLAEACAIADIPCDRLHDAIGLDRDIARLELEEALIRRGLAPH